VRDSVRNLLCTDLVMTNLRCLRKGRHYEIFEQEKITISHVTTPTLRGRFPTTSNDGLVILSVIEKEISDIKLTAPSSGL
jgi:hypothetical protein